jgi:hypothetical protein
MGKKIKLCLIETCFFKVLERQTLGFERERQMGELEKEHIHYTAVHKL